jgi:hypothetical protein
MYPADVGSPACGLASLLCICHTGMRYRQPLCDKSIWQHNLKIWHMRMVVILSAARLGRSCIDDSRPGLRQTNRIAGGYLDPDYGACLSVLSRSSRMFQNW